jgi:ribonucrease Y
MRFRGGFLMNWLSQLILPGTAFLILGAVLGLGWARWREHQLRRAASLQAQATLENARREAESVTREARLAANEEAIKLREQTEKAFALRRRELHEQEERLSHREGLINQQLETLLERERTLLGKNQDLERQIEQLALRQKQLDALLVVRKEELTKLSHLNETEAKALFLKQVEEESLRDANTLSRHIMEAARNQAEDQAQRLISLAIQRYAGTYTFETTTATLALPGEEIKGRIIGREGRNIRAFEAATGITVLIDDTPNAVVLSGFDPVRREIARESMQRLIQDGRIHPTRIEEVVGKVSAEIDETILKTGEEAVFRLGLPPMHMEIVKLLGRLRFRQSFSQNILDHSIEVAHLTGMMAAELGLDVSMAKRAGLLHDIGKAMNHEVEGSHAIIGADFVKRHGESEEVVNGVASHHDEVPHTNLFGILVSAADAMSASRPGARSETMTTYIKRLESLEQIGLSFPGVDKCFAVQAGRELRVVVHPDQIQDEQAFILARNIVRKIEEELQYPGQIRVTVVRETRYIEFAK